MKYLTLFIIVIALGFLGFSSFQEQQKDKKKSKCSIVSKEMVFQEKFFPFGFKDYNTKELLKYFKSGVKVDSVEKNIDGYISTVYKFHDGVSSINFFAKPYDKSDRYFYIQDSKIETKLLPFRNGIKIGMSKTEFCRIANFNSALCDTFLIQEGEMATSYYFIFKK
ncbi:hypothetical protein D4R20_02995, partial [bacterium]